MNPKDLLNAIKTALLARKWSDSASNSVVFGTGSVAITRGLTEDALRSMRVPAALIMPGSDRSDPEYDEEPDLIVQTVVVRIINSAAGDAIGENVILGSNRPLSTKSEGAGLLEVAEEVCGEIERLNEQDGITIQFRRKGGMGGIHVSDNVRWEYMDLEFEAVCTTA